MRRAAVVLSALLLCLLLVSCGISKDKAADIALESLGMTKVYVQKWEVSKDKAKNVYEVSVWKDAKHVVTVDAKTGSIISSVTIPENC